MPRYFLRTAHAPEQVKSLALLLGVLETKDGGIGPAQGVTWTEIGELPDTSKIKSLDEDGNPVYYPLTQDGKVLWHCNVDCPFDLQERATQLAAKRPEIAAALHAVPDFFVVDESGRARAPKNPALIFWGVQS